MGFWQKWFKPLDKEFKEMEARVKKSTQEAEELWAHLTPKQRKVTEAKESRSILSCMPVEQPAKGNGKAWVNYPDDPLTIEAARRCPEIRPGVISAIDLNEQIAKLKDENWRPK